MSILQKWRKEQTKNKAKQKGYKYEVETQNSQSFFRLSLDNTLLLLPIAMSIINLFSVKQTLIGSIKTKETKNYAFFSLNDTQVKRELSSTFHAINENIKAKSYKGELKFCRFVDHDGKS